jgi:hypothetical protein
MKDTRHINVDIHTKWDMDYGNIVYKKNQDVFNIKVSNNFNKWHYIDKLDYLCDLSNWIQHEVDKIHKNIGPEKSSVLISRLGVLKPSERNENVEQ